MQTARLLQLVLKPYRPAEFSGDDHVQVAVVVEFLDDDARANTDPFVAGSSVLGPNGVRPASQFVIVNAQRPELVLVVSVVGHESLAGEPTEDGTRSTPSRDGIYMTLNCCCQ